MRAAGDGLHGRRLRGLIVVLWRAGLRITEALALAETDLDQRRGAVLVRRGKGGRRREVGMDDWAWEQLEPWLTARIELSVGPLFCIITGPRADDAGQAPPSAASCATPPTLPECADASRHTSSATPTPSRWHTTASHCSSSSDNSDTPTSGSPRSTSKASTTPRSSKPSTHDEPRWFRSTSRYDRDAPTPVLCCRSSRIARASAPPAMTLASRPQREPMWRWPTRPLSGGFRRSRCRRAGRARRASGLNELVAGPDPAVGVEDHGLDADSSHLAARGHHLPPELDDD
jgi:hypothetical protein